MARDQNTIMKRLREVAKKRKQEEKRTLRRKRKEQEKIPGTRVVEQESFEDKPSSHSL